MPCCGLHEYRRTVPLKYMVSGGAVFWSTFAAALLFGLVMVWSARGRLVLRIQAEFLRSLWLETMRSSDSIPARWSCRLSGLALRISPRLATVIYRHPELAFIYAPLVALGVLLSGGLVLLQRL
jgi:hypothetical protein